MIRGQWINETPQRVMTIAASYDLQDTDDNPPDVAFVGVAVFPNGAPDLSEFAEMAKGRLRVAWNEQDISSTLRKLLELGDEPTPRSQVPSRPTPTVTPTPDGDPSVTPDAVVVTRPPRADPAPGRVETSDQVELERLYRLETWLKEDPERHLFRRHYQPATGTVFKRLEKSGAPELDAATNQVSETETLSPRISSRLLTRAIQQLQ